VLNGACATALFDRARSIDPLCTEIARRYGRLGTLPAAAEWLQLRAQLREELVRGGQMHLADAAPAAAEAGGGAAAIGRGGPPDMLRRRAARQAADVDLYLELMDAAARSGHTAAAAALLRMACEQPVAVQVGQGLVAVVAGGTP
jgi:hypothetical protein